tara:strand:+ start:4324 stop:4950 length:627 start_codon:yes stop_codon:yes gene_type:complete
MSGNKNLVNLLGNARKLMNKVETGDYSPGNVNSGMMVEDTGQLLSQIPENANATSRPVSNKPIQNTYVNINKTKMDPKIVQAMVENPIEIPHVNFGSAGGGAAFDLEDVAELLPNNNRQVVSEQKFVSPEVSTREPTTNFAPPQVRNSAGQVLLTLTEAELDKKIQDALLEFMAKTFAKTLTENTIKKTMNVLIKEGKLSVKTRKKPI